MPYKTLNIQTNETKFVQGERFLSRKQNRLRPKVSVKKYFELFSKVSLKCFFFFTKLGMQFIHFEWMKVNE
jgi:hypothetical protein